MRLSLRIRVLLLVFSIHAAVFGAGMWFLVGRIAAARADQGAEILGYTLSNTIVPGGELKVAQILDSPHWRLFEDAILVDRNLDRSRATIRPLGVFLNPLGSERRGADVHVEAALRDVDTAILERRRVEGAQG